MLLCQSSEFRRSDEGEIRRVEEQDRPALVGDLVLQAELPEVALARFVGDELEVGHALPELQPPTGPLVASPGCYATAVLLALAPIADAVYPASVVVDRNIRRRG